MRSSSRVVTNITKEKHRENNTYLEGVVRTFLGRESHVEAGPGPGVTRVLFLLIEARSLVENPLNVAAKLQ